MSDNDERNRSFDSGNGPTPPEHASEDPRPADDQTEPVSAELLSAYLDDPDDLQPEVRQRIEEELATSAEARRTLHELQMIVQGLQSLPEVAAPRSYHLTPDMVGAPEPVQMQETRAWYVRHTEAIRWATAVAAILFVFVFTADLVTNGIGPGGRSGDDDDSQTFTTAADSGGDESSTLRAADDGSDSDASDAGGASEAQLQPPADDAAGDAEPTPAAEEEAASAGEAEEEAADDSSGAADAVPVPEQDTASGEAAVTAVPGDGGDEAEAEEAEETEDTPITLDAPSEEATEAGAESGAVPEPDDGEGPGDADTAANSGANQEQQYLAVDESSQERSDDRTVWRAVEFSLIFILALLLTAMIILPRLGRAPSESRGPRR